MMKPNTPWKRLTVSSLLLALPLFGGGCGSQAKVGAQYTAPSAETLAAESQQLSAQYGRQLEAGQGRVMPLDLSDDTHYRFLMDRVLSSGNTPENSPTLFETVEGRREYMLKLRSKGQLAQGLQRGGFCDHFIHITESDDATYTYFTAKPVVSCTDGAPYVYADIYAYKTNQTETQPFVLLGSNYGEQYNNGKYFVGVSLSVQVLKTEKVALIFESTVIGEDVVGNYQESYTRAKTTTDGLPPLLTVEHPRELINTGTTNQIRTCLERGTISGNLDCDYATVRKNTDGTFTVYPPGGSPAATGVAGVDKRSALATNNWKADATMYWPTVGAYNTTHLYLPLKGAFSANLTSGTTSCNIESYDSSLTTTNIILAEKGGTCTAGQEVGTTVGVMDLRSALATGYPQSSYSTLADYGAKCLGNLQNVRLLVQVSAQVRCPGDATLYTRYRSTLVEPLDFSLSCFAEGTRVQRADGKLTTIETVKVGDKLMANADGLALTVTGVTRGGEHQPMVRVQDNQGHEALVTAQHPVVLKSGKVVPAEKLAVGDQVKTDKGEATLTSVGRETYAGQVWNVALGTPQELAQAGLSNRTLFANGFLMGDSEMQTELARQPVARSEDVMRALPSRWQRDYQKDLARGGRVF